MSEDPKRPTMHLKVVYDGARNVLSVVDEDTGSRLPLLDGGLVKFDHIGGAIAPELVTVRVDLVISNTEGLLHTPPPD